MAASCVTALCAEAALCCEPSGLAAAKDEAKPVGLNPAGLALAWTELGLSNLEMAESSNPIDCANAVRLSGLVAVLAGVTMLSLGLSATVLSSAFAVLGLFCALLEISATSLSQGLLNMACAITGA